MDGYGYGWLAFFGAFLGIVLLYGLIAYIVGAMALKRMADKLSIENSWFAFIPIANAYLLGKVAGDKLDLFGYQIENLAFILLGGSAISFVISQVPVIGFLFGIAFAVVAYATLYKVYMMFVPNSAMLYLILSIVLAIIAPFLMYAASTKDPIVEDSYIELE
ncbi:MAG: hypothetical protein GX941_04580 [Candidatus Methanofastidiosa archaeon]|nr:hypothetical protein [Candidatus Methanofastidiosa archaeon]